MSSSSPFKFLDAFTRQDQHLFFGREEEIEELYQRIFKSNLLLVYGASGTGKTSLIQCGLSSKFSEDNWFSVYIRRQENINKSLYSRIVTNSVTKLTSEDLDPDESEIVQRVEGLYLDHFKPIYLIFDQLEELFILGDEEEQQRFYKNIKDLVGSTVQCKIILIIREEYIASLSGMEEVIPSLFDNRVRIEKMRKRKVKDVIDKSCDIIPEIDIVGKEQFLDKVIENLSEDELTVELTYLQVYLDKLYKNSDIVDGIHLFNMDLLKDTGKVKDVLAQFLEDQVQMLSNPEIGWKILKVFITKDGTKKSASLDEIEMTLINQNIKLEKNVIFSIINRFRDAKILTALEGSLYQYEFTHDSLAIKTFEKLDAKERSLFEIESLIAQQYNSYSNRGILLDKDNLIYISPYLEDLNLSGEQKAFIQKSKKEISKKRKRNIAAIIGVIAALSILSLFLLFFSRQNIKIAKTAERQTELLREQKEKLEDALERADFQTLKAVESQKIAKKAQLEAEKNLLLADEKTLEAQAEREKADEARKILAIQKRKTEDDLKVQIKNVESRNLANLAEKNVAIDPNRALEYAAEAYELNPSSSSITALMQVFHQPLKLDSFEFSDVVTEVTFGRRRNIYFLGLQNGLIMLCDEELDNCREMLGHKGSIEAVASGPSGNRIYTSANDRTIKIWDSLGKFIESKSDFLSTAIKIEVVSNDEVIVAFENGNIVSYNGNLNAINYTIEQTGILGVTDLIVTNNSELLAIDQLGRVWVFNSNGDLINTISQSRIKTMVQNGSDLYYLQESGELETIQIRKLLQKGIKALEGTSIPEFTEKGIGLDLLDNKRLAIYHNGGLVSILDLESKKSKMLFISESSIVAPFNSSKKKNDENNFLTCTPDGFINVYDMSHMRFPFFKFKSYQVEKSEEVIQDNYSFKKLGDDYLINDRVNPNQQLRFSIDEQPKPNSNFWESYYRDTIDNLVFEGTILKDSGSNFASGTTYDVDIRLKDKDTDQEIYYYEKISGIRSIQNILISDDQKFALVFVYFEDGKLGSKLYPLPKYVYKFSKSINEN
ncbi:MAG: AAA family ATPase [Bacteroidota bacterium]